MGTFGCPVSSLIFSVFLEEMECPGPQATVVGFSTGKIIRETKHSTQVTTDPSSEPLNQREQSCLKNHSVHRRLLSLQQALNKCTFPHPTSFQTTD